MKRLITKKEWNDTKVVRGVPDQIYLYSELDEQLIAGRGIIKNTDYDSASALKGLNDSIDDGSFTLKKIPIKLILIKKSSSQLNKYH